MSTDGEAEHSHSSMRVARRVACSWFARARCSHVCRPSSLPPADVVIVNNGPGGFRETVIVNDGWGAQDTTIITQGGGGWGGYQQETVIVNDGWGARDTVGECSEQCGDGCLASPTSPSVLTLGLPSRCMLAVVDNFGGGFGGYGGNDVVIINN